MVGVITERWRRGGRYVIHFKVGEDFGEGQAGFLSLALTVLKLTEMEQWSWWRILLPLWVILGHNAMYLLVGFLCLFAVRYGEDEKEEEPAKVQSDRIFYQAASLVCVLISTDNLLRWLERGGKSYWFWLRSGSLAMVVLFGALALVVQFVYWADIVRAQQAAS